MKVMLIEGQRLVVVVLLQVMAVICVGERQLHNIALHRIISLMVHLQPQWWTGDPLDRTASRSCASHKWMSGRQFQMCGSFRQV